jgi:hypothetical protein
MFNDVPISLPMVGADNLEQRIRGNKLRHGATISTGLRAALSGNVR